MIGVAIAGLIGSLGAAGAAVAVTCYFLAYLKDRFDREVRRDEALIAEYRAALAQFRDDLAAQRRALREVVETHRWPRLPSDEIETDHSRRWTPG